jgi:hypothetical protein
MHTARHTRRTVPLALLLLLAAASPATLPSGDAVIRGHAGESDIVITTTSRFAGAIGSLTWNGREFIDSADHGRELQSAASFDFGPDSFKPFIPETFNPTEAGSRDDGAKPTSTSRLRSIRAAGDTLETTTQMAFWLQPGEKSAGHLARNLTPLSDHLISKRVQIGYKQWPHAIRYDVTFTMPAGEPHEYAQFEALTGYMPAQFDHFWKFNAASKQLEPLDDGPGEIAQPVVLATADGKFAMGVYSPEQPSPGFAKSGYGRFKFEHAKVVKWNCVFRLRQPAAGEHRFTMFTLVGTLEDVRETIAGLKLDDPAR